MEILEKIRRKQTFGRKRLSPFILVKRKEGYYVRDFDCSFVGSADERAGCV